MLKVHLTSDCYERKEEKHKCAYCDERSCTAQTINLRNWNAPKLCTQAEPKAYKYLHIQDDLYWNQSHLERLYANAIKDKMSEEKSEKPRISWYNKPDYCEVFCLLYNKKGYQ